MNAMHERFESGSECPECGGLVQVVNTVVEGSNRIRYLGCRECGWRPDDNKRVVPIAHAPRRMRRLNLRRR